MMWIGVNHKDALQDINILLGFVRMFQLEELVLYIVMREMEDRNVLYEIKKQANQRANQFHHYNTEDDDIRNQNKRLRTQLRSKDTEIYRLNSKIDELNKQLQNYLLTTKKSVEHSEHSAKQLVSNLSSIPMVLQNRQLKQSNQILHQENLELNGKNNKLEAEVRQMTSDKYQLELKVKELEILQKMREQRFRDEVDRLTPVVIQQPEEFTQVKQSVEKLTDFIRLRIVEVVDNIFMVSAKECEGKKKTNSFTIFRNYWLECKSQRAYGFAAVVSTYKAIYKVIKTIDENYGDFSEQEQTFKGTINEWVLESLIQIKNTPNKEEQRRLFRLLGLHYRCKYPIKGETHEMSEKVRGHLQATICWEVLRLLFLKQ